MIVLVLDKAPAPVRGEVTRWLLELKPGVFAGTVSALVREKLWQKVQGAANVGGGFLLYPSNNEQGFILRSFGESHRKVIDLDGLFLIRKPI